MTETQNHKCICYLMDRKGLGRLEDGGANLMNTCPQVGVSIPQRFGGREREVSK